jgi:hypothetical protein
MCAVDGLLFFSFHPNICSNVQMWHCLNLHDQQRCWSFEYILRFDYHGRGSRITKTGKQQALGPWHELNVFTIIPQQDKRFGSSFFAMPRKTVLWTDDATV